MLHRLLMLLPACASLALAKAPAPAESVVPAAASAVPWTVPDIKAPAPPAAELVKPSVKQLDATKYQIGGVIFDRVSREIRFSAKVQNPEYPIEYLIVLANGSAHESLLLTEISPTDLNLAFTLLHYQPSPDVPAQLDASGQSAATFPAVKAEVKAAACIGIVMEWSQDGKVQHRPVNEVLQIDATGKKMPAGPWVFSGSDFVDGKFAPETSGNIATVNVPGYSLIYNPRELHDNETTWTPLPKSLPPQGTEITVIITPYQKTKSLPKP